MAIGDFFKKFRKEDTVIDLGDMQKRGIIKKRNEIKANKNEVVDLTETNSLGFLGSLVNSSSEVSNEPSETGSFKSSLNTSPDGRTKLKGILRDLKIDLKNTTDRIYKLTDRLDLIEKKIDRLERRAGVSG